MPYVWDEALSDTEREIIRRGNYGQSHALGKRPAVIIIDAQVNYVGENRPILDQIDRFPSGIGDKAWQVLPKIRQLIDAARANRIRLIFTKMRKPLDRQVEQSKTLGFYGNIKRPPNFMSDNDPGQRVVDDLSPRPNLGDLIIYKEQPSAFFGTPLAAYCINWRIDTLLLAGGSTSGCVRATAVDAASLSLHLAVIEDCVFDRIELSHKATLLDIWMKYGNVVDLQQILDYLDGLNKLEIGSK